MAVQLDSLTLAGLTRKVSEAVADNIDQIIDCHAIVLAIFNKLADGHDIHAFSADSDTLTDFIADNIHESINTRNLGKLIARGLGEAGFVDKPTVGVSAANVGIGESTAATVTGTTAITGPRPQPSMPMDATALREQILGALPNHMPLTYTD